MPAGGKRYHWWGAEFEKGAVSLMPGQGTPPGGERPRERRCPVCGAALEGVGESDSGEFRCSRCRTVSRFERENLLALHIPGYHRRILELESMNRQLVKEIEAEGRKGPDRDPRVLGEKHRKRQDVLFEYGFLSDFSRFVEKW